MSSIEVDPSFQRKLDVSGAPVPGSAGDILVVDDNPDNLLAIEAALADFGGTLYKVGSGADALRSLLTRDFALVLLDVQMPNMDGFETARLIRARERTRHVPIIFVTAYSRDDEQILRGYALGAVDFLFKPIVPEVLQAKASVFVALQRHTAEVARQAELLRQHEGREHERRIVEEKQKWEKAAMRRKMMELAEADRRKDEFLAILGHELRNPIAPIINGLAVLAREDAKPATIQRARAAMDRQARHLARLVDDLLDVSRITSGKIELRLEPMPIGPILEHALAMCQPLIEERAHELVVEIEHPELTVYADGVRLTQVVSNLLNNAAKYTAPRGHMHLVCTEEGNEVVIRIIDDGPGIAPEFVDSVFDLFVQATPGCGGLGIGLTLVSYLVKMHQGTVEIAAAPDGRGCMITVRLPVFSPQDPPESDFEVAPAAVGACTLAPGLASAGTTSTPSRIVVIDDNSDIRETLGDLLELWGHEVQLAPDGEKGLELVMRTRPDLALVDIGMPFLDGYEVATRVRESFAGDAVMLIAMTGFGQAGARERSLGAGFDAHMVKPVDATVLRETLEALRREQDAARNRSI